MPSFLSLRSVLSVHALACLGGVLALGACSSTAAVPVDAGTDSAIAPIEAGAPPDATPGPTTFSYSAKPTPATADEGLALVMAQGAAGHAYVGPYIGKEFPTPGEIFLRPTPATTFTYAREPATPGTPAQFVARLDAKGKEGFAFKGPLIVGGGNTAHDYFVKSASKNVVFTYATKLAVEDEAATLKDFDEMGAQGFSYLADTITDSRQPDTRVRLFQKASGSAVTFKYVLKPTFADKATFETTLTAQGKAGGVWKGPIGVGASFVNVFEVASPALPAIAYKVIEETGPDATALAAQLDPLGAQRFFYLGSYFLDGKLQAVLMQGPPTALALSGTVLP